MTRVRVSVFPEELRQEAFDLSTDGRKDIAYQILDKFRATAPVRSGSYRREAEVEVDGSQVFVVDDDPSAFYKEYGTSRTQAHATLTNAARQFGKYRGFSPRGGAGRGSSNKVRYVTASGRVRMISRAQADYFRRGAS